MRIPSFFPGFLRCLAIVACAMMCVGVASAQTTTFSGTVYSPLGVPPPNGTGAGDPIPNILVFVVAPGYPPPTFTPGLTQPTGSQTGCEAQPDLVPAFVLGQALSDAAGHFSFTTSGPLPNPLTLVIQAGKWRQQYTYTNIVAGQPVNPFYLSMPAQQIAGVADLPRIAIVTGNADSVECIFKQIGINTSVEVTDPGGSGSIQLFQGATGPGQFATTAANAGKEASLVGNPSTLDTYDVVIFGCQGSTAEAAATATNQQNIINFANMGGRVFATHYGYNWLYNIQPFESSATWSPGLSEPYTPPYGSSSASGVATVNTSGSFTEGTILATWLQNIGASYNGVYGEMQLNELRDDTKGSAGTLGVNPVVAQSWVNVQDAALSNPSMQFTFDTPIGAAGTPTVTIAYQNISNQFLQGDAGDEVQVNVTNTSGTATNPGLTLTVVLPSGITGANPTLVPANGSSSSWNCNPQPGLTCTSSGLGAGISDAVDVYFNVAPTAAVGNSVLSASLSGGGLSSSGQCGRVLFNDYHVEQGSGSVLFPKDCSTGLTAQERFLEFSLYNLSNFVAPTTTDTVDIQGVTTLAWTPQPNSIPYGTYLTSGMLDATAMDLESNTAVPGTIAYSYNGNTITLPSTLLLPAGNNTLTVCFVPSTPSNYTTPACLPAIIQVTPDNTSTTFAQPPTPIFYGLAITLSGGTVTSGGPATALDGGTFSYILNGVPYCTTTEPAQPPTCTAGAGLDAGTYVVSSAYSGDNNFNPSTGGTYNVVIAPDPTSVALISSTGTLTPGQAVTFTATVTDSYAPAVGTVTFFDGPTAIGTGSVTGTNNIATLTVSNLIVGPHNITACFVGALSAAGVEDFLPSCSPGVLEIVTFPPTTIPTVTLLSSNLNPSVQGETVVMSVAVATTGAFSTQIIGAVALTDNGVSIAAVPLDATGKGTVSLSNLALGTHNLVASYVGYFNILPSTSNTVVQVVTAPLPSAGNGFMMTITPTTFTVGAGSSISIPVNILELNNFNQPVQLACSGLPSEMTCNFLTPLIPAIGGTTQLIVGASAPHTCGTNDQYFTAQGGRTGLPLFALAALVFFARRRRVLKGVLLAAVICILPTLSGCGGTCTDLGVKPGTYSFTVTGTSTGTPVVTRAQTMTVTVKI